MHRTPVEFIEADSDFEQEMKSLFNVMQFFPVRNPNALIEKYITTLYAVSNPSYINVILKLLLRVDMSIKLTVKNSTYFLFDFT